jgi:Zn-dependent peptidase ImmA (M78 family)
MTTWSCVAKPDPAQLASRLRDETVPADQAIDVFAYLRSRPDIVLIRRSGSNPQIDGIYMRDERTKAGFIYLNRAKPLGRQRFTAAHELGHHLLGHVDELDVDVMAEQQSQEERDANRFAAELLVPRRGVMKFVLKEKLDPTRIEGAVRVAKHFRVTLQPALIQLQRADLVTSVDVSRLLVSAAALKPNPFAEYERLDSSDKTELPSRYVEAVAHAYQAGTITAESAGDALDLPAEAVADRFAGPTELESDIDLSDLF